MDMNFERPKVMTPPDKPIEKIGKLLYCPFFRNGNNLLNCAGDECGFYEKIESSQAIIECCRRCNCIWKHTK